MTATSISMNEESFYHTSFTYQNLETSPNTYFVPSLSDNSNDVYLNESDMQPYLHIEVQPCDKFRFRYSSETGSHGKVRGPAKNRLKTNFPTIKLFNRDDSQGKIEVKASLYTYEQERRPHILELVGKNCRDGGCWETLSDNDTAIFRFLEIENKRKEEAINILMERKKHAGRRQNKEKMKEEAQDEFKLFNMNCTVLCFEAFQNGNPITEKVFSDPIKNLKSTSSDLKISRISSCSGSCKGGDEVILLCDKINKDDIEIHFYEKGDYDNFWKAKGEFNPKVDVHHQVAIVFKTPEYKHNYLGTVYMELYRRSDKQSSEPIMFTYVPDEIESLRDSKKRRLNSYESQPSTSSGYDSSTPISPMPNFSFPMEDTEIPLQFEIGSILDSTESCDEVELPDMVDADKLLDLNGFTVDVISQILADAPEPLSLCPKEKFPTARTEMDYSSFPTESMLQEAFGDTEFNFEAISTLPQEPTLAEEVSRSKELKDHDYSMLPPNITQSGFARNRGGYTLPTSSSYSLTDMLRDGFDYVRNIFPATTTASGKEIVDEMPCSGGLGIGSLAIYGLKSGMEKLIPRDKPSHSTKNTKTISKSGQKEAASYDSYQPADDQIYAQSALIFDMTKLSIDDDKTKAMKHEDNMASPITVEAQSATRTNGEENKGSKNAVGIGKKFEYFKESIGCILKNRQEGVYLQYISKLLSVSDENGNTFLHLAIREQSENANLIAKIVEMRPDFVNKQNNFKETPLHMATRMNEHKIVLLLLLKGGNPSIVNANGSNCFHIASQFKFTNVMKMLLLPSLKYGKDIPSIDDINYEGFAPIHLAVLNNAKECLKFLIQAGADVNIRHRKSGIAPLNLALQRQPSLVDDLLCHPHIDLLNQDFHGDTFIHTLCNMKGGIQVPRFKHSKDLVDWARKALALPSIDACEDSSEDSDTDVIDEESENEEDATASNGEYSVSEEIMYHEQLIIDYNDVDRNSLNEECEEQLRCYLDASSGWRKLGLSIGFSEKTLDGLATLSKNSSPSKVILRKIKVLYKNCDRQTLVNILKEADLEEAAKILK